jgi:uroporphyrinogen decarboxylase
MYKHDNVMAGFGCGSIEAHALGSVWTWERRELYYPKIIKFGILKPEDVDTIEPVNPTENLIMQNCIKALSIMKKKIGNKVAVIGFLNGPLLVAEELRGCDAIFSDMIIRPKLAHRILDIVTKTCLNYGKAMIEVGVHGIFIEDGTAGADQISPEQSMEFDIPYLKVLVDEFKKRNCWVILHNCSTAPYLEQQAALRPSVLTFVKNFNGYS